MRLLLAPIQGTTISNYRNLHAMIFGGFDEYYSPFIATTSVRNVGKTVFKDILPEDNKVPVIPQLLGNKGDDFRHYAKLITDLGYREINWNIGCPYPTVVKKKKGSGIMADADMVRQVLEEACKDNNYGLTVKMRLGQANLEEGFKVMEVLNDYPLKGVMIHARTGIQKYEGVVDLDAFEDLYKMCQHEMTYNGDIFNYEDYKKIQERFPDIKNFMLARGALRDPFLAATIKNGGIVKEDKMLKVKAFHDGIFDYYKEVLSGDKHLGDKMKEFWYHMSMHIEDSDKHLKKIKKCKSADDYLYLAHDLMASKQWIDKL